jgi:hypothetical protein
MTFEGIEANPPVQKESEAPADTRRTTEMKSHRSQATLHRPFGMRLRTTGKQTDRAKETAALRMPADPQSNQAGERIPPCENPPDAGRSSSLPEPPTTDNEGDGQHESEPPTTVSPESQFEGVFEIERLLEKKRFGKVLWLKIKWKTVAKGSWEKAEHMQKELGEEAYQELLETKPRKRRKKAAKW